MPPAAGENASLTREATPAGWPVKSEGAAVWLLGGFPKGAWVRTGDFCSAALSLIMGSRLFLPPPCLPSLLDSSPLEMRTDAFSRFPAGHRNERLLACRRACLCAWRRSARACAPPGGAQRAGRFERLLSSASAARLTRRRAPAPRCPAAHADSRRRVARDSRR